METKSGRRVITSENYVERAESVKRLEKKKSKQENRHYFVAEIKAVLNFW
ncbi:MAG TPA: hypothetical protein VJI32_05185 [Candidatus Nanoarchaeia archaeon]|nr:hypothetical protein [Candidatus Nanoarchaeia archaeon]